MPEGHKCARLHGHSYRVEIHVSGDVGEPSGWVCDFANITEAFKPLRKQLDHNLLNELAGLENPTSEHLAPWVWDRLALPGLTEVRVSETEGSGCVYRGEP